MNSFASAPVGVENSNRRLLRDFHQRGREGHRGAQKRCHLHAAHRSRELLESFEEVTDRLGEGDMLGGILDILVGEPHLELAARDDDEGQPGRAMDERDESAPTHRIATGREVGPERGSER